MAPATLHRRRARAAGPGPKDRLFGVGLVTPTLLVTLALLAYPLLASFWYSLFDVRLGGRTSRFVGLGNYVSVVTDPIFMPALTRTVLFAVTVTVLTVAMGLGFALVLDGEFRGRTLLLARFPPTIHKILPGLYMRRWPKPQKLKDLTALASLFGTKK